MDENFSWKIVYIAAIFSLVVLGFAYWLISPRESTFFSEEKTEKIAEFDRTRVEGRKEGKKAWEFYAKQGWTNKNQEITFLSDVTRGEIYKDGKPILIDLSAPLLKAYRRAEVIEAYSMRSLIDLGKISAEPGKKSDWTRLKANYIKYNTNEKKSEISGNISLIRRDSVIDADRIMVDHEKKTASLAGRIVVRRKDGKIHADSAEYLGEAEQLNLNGKVFITLREKKILSSIKCNQATLFNDQAIDINFSGSVEAIQGKKIAVAQTGVYSKKDKSLRLSGGTKTIIEKAKAVFKPETVRRLHNADAINMLKEKTIVIADGIAFSTKTGDAKARGHVEVTQKGRQAKSDTAIYDDKKELLTLSGNVSLKKGEDWISCRQVVISVGKESFEASGVSEAKFKL
jgi:lipopolysaccharide export system protein LptA